MKRRTFLTTLGKKGVQGVVATSFLQQFFQNIASGFISEAYGMTPGNRSKFLMFMQEGSGPLWNTYLPLISQPSDLNDLISNPGVFQRFGNGLTKEIAHHAISNNNPNLGAGDPTHFYMPHMWSQTIPTVNNGFVPLENLTQNLLALKGVDIQSVQHNQARSRVAGIKSSAPNLLGKVADVGASDFPIPSSALDQNCLFIQSLQSSCSFGSGGNPIKNMMTPFDLKDQATAQEASDKLNLIVKSNQVESIINDIATQMAARFQHGPKQLQDKTNAISLFKKAYNNLDLNAYTQIRNKYQNLITTALTAQGTNAMVGVNDQAIPILNRVDQNGNTLSSINPEFYIHNHTNNLTPGTDLRSFIHSSTKIQFLAESFAFSEYLLVHNLSCAIYNRFGVMYSLKLNGGTQNMALSPDAHAVGGISAFFFLTMGMRAVYACMYELIQQLQNHNLFNNTVIQLGGEFGRCPRVETHNGVKYAAGSDHAGNASAMLLFSGKLPYFQVTGNCFNQGVGINPANYPGSYGTAAGFGPNGSGDSIKFEHVNKTIASLLDGVQFNDPRGFSLIDSNGKILLPPKNFVKT